jgi:hypothetical protein
MEDFALRSHVRALPADFATRSSVRGIADDECPRETSLEKMAALIALA